MCQFFAPLDKNPQNKTQPPHTQLSMHFKDDAHAQLCTSILCTDMLPAWLQVLSWLVLRLCGGKVILQEALQVLESWPLLRFLPPAAQHQLMKGFGALCWTWHPITTLHLV